MPTPRPVLLAWDATAAPRQGSGRKHWIIRVEFNLGGQRNAEEVLVSGGEGTNDGELESSLERWRDKDVQWKQGRGHAQLSAAAIGIVSVLHINQQFSSSELQHMQAALILQEVPPIS